MQSTNLLSPSPKIGILGGGQLGQMLIEAAIPFNLDISVLDPSLLAPCRPFISQFVQGSLIDYDTVMAFGADKEVITIEIENVNTLALHHLEAQGKKVYPQPHIIELIQDKRLQKQFYQLHGYPTAEFILTENAQDVAANAHFLPSFHKLGKEGYDGKGVVKISSLTDLDKAFDKPGLLEKLVQFEKEITVIVARNPQGAVSCYDAVELVYHEQNMVDYLLAPAQINIEIQQKAQVLATSIINSLGMVGILAVEMFLTPSGALLINEIAPRPHNSGHHTIEACFCSQFTQHWRAILGLPLGNTALRSKAAMVNLIGHANYSGTAKYLGVESILEDPSAYLHLYGKAETRPHRKMGHFTILRPNFQELQNALLQLKNEVQVVAQ